MRIHCIQHEKFEKPAFIETWANTHGHTLTSTLVFNPHFYFPSPSQFDLLVILGGSMSTYEEEKHPFLIQEKTFIKACASIGKNILGICLGSQLLADTLGGKVYPNKEKEIGWFPIQLTEKGMESPIFKNCEKSITVFHWHGDTFDLPEKAVHLALSDGCQNQAFTIGQNILGLQFHLEIEPSSVELMVKFGTDELIEGQKYVQNGSKILNGNMHIPKNNAIMQNILQYFVQMN